MEDHARILRSIILVGVFVFAGRIFGAAREVVLAAQYGTSETINAYLFVVNVVNWPIAVWLSTLTVVLVPLFVRFGKSSPEDVRQFTIELAIAATGLGILLALAFSFALPYTATIPAMALSPNSATLIDEIALPLSSVMPFGFLAGLLAARLMSVGRHINTLLEGVPALLVAASVALFPSGAAPPLVWGTIVGFGVYTAALLFFYPRGTGNWLWRPEFRSTMWTPFLRGFWIVAAGQLILSATTVLDQVMVAGLSDSAVAVLAYANRLLALLLGLGATAVARATLPVFSELASGEADRMARTGILWMRALFAAGIVGVAVAWSLTQWGVEILFERGAFTSADTLAVSDVLRLGLLQIPFYVSSIVAVQVLAARGRYDQILLIAVVNVAVKVSANLLLIDMFGIGGVMLATALMYAVSMWLAWFLAFKSGGIELRKTAGEKRAAWS